MKESDIKTKALVKGAPSGFVISLLVHAGAFLLAGMLVVFSVTLKDEKKFIPPKPVERPKMKLKKPKVKVRKTAKPKAATRIVTKVKRASMPDIQLPEMSGMGTGIAGRGLDGFDLLPDLGELTAFGSEQSIGNDLVGTFYDLKRGRSGRLIPYSRDKFYQDTKEFVRKGFRPSEFAQYYRSPQKLFATSIMIPPILSSMGPMAYGEPDTPGCLFLIHYTGQLVYPEDITFRFWGGSGDVLLVGVDGEVVLNGCWENDELLYWPMWTSSAAEHRKHRLGFQGAAVGDWITLKAGEPRKLDVLIGEVPGGGFSAEMLVEVKGQEYERNKYGSPILPIFKTARLSQDQMDAIYIDLVEDEACLTNGPVFCDYDMSQDAAEPAVEPHEPVEIVEDVVPPNADPMRIWTFATGKSVEAEYVRRIGNNVILQQGRNNVKKVPWSNFSESDREFIELETPPKLDFSLSKKTYNRPKLDPGPYIVWVPPNLIDYVFTAKVKQTSAGAYNHELYLTYYVFGEEVDGDNYILLDRQTSSFILTEENDRAFALSGPKVLLYAYLDYWSDLRGGKYGGYLITVTDKRGKTIAQGTSHDWMPGIQGELEKLPIGRHFNKQGQRVIPPRPKLNYSAYF